LFGGNIFFAVWCPSPLGDREVCPDHNQTNVFVMGSLSVVTQEFKTKFGVEGAPPGCSRFPSLFCLVPRPCPFFFEADSGAKIVVLKSFSLQFSVLFLGGNPGNTNVLFELVCSLQKAKWEIL